MINLSNQIEMAIKIKVAEAINACRFCGVFISSNDETITPMSCEDLVKTNTLLNDCYEEPILYEIPDEFAHEFRKHSRVGNVIKMREIACLHGIQCSLDDALMVNSAFFLYAQGQVNMAKAIMGHFYETRLRTDYYTSFVEKIKAEAYRHKMVENASKPRNKFYDQAMKLLKNTWEKYPGAGKKSLFKSVRKELSGRVSESTLERWAKAAGLGPDPAVKRTSFSLVRD